MSGGSGLLDIERRVELAALERLRGFADLLGLLSAPTDIVVNGDASSVATWPGVYVEAYNMAEYGTHTGNYMGGLRLGAYTYKDDDKDNAKAKQFLGAFRMWAQQIDLVSLLNGTASAQATGSKVWFFAAELDINGTGGNPGFITEATRKTNANEAVLEISIVCAPSRP